MLAPTEISAVPVLETPPMTVYRIVLVFGVEHQLMMIVAFVVVIIPAVQIVRAKQMVVHMKMSVAHVIQIAPMTVYRIVLVFGVEHQLMRMVAFVVVRIPDRKRTRLNCR